MAVRLGHSGRVDNTQAEIIRALEQAGMRARSIAVVGNGFPDLLVRWRGRTYLLEVKTGNARLTAAEEQWRETWPGHYAIVRTPDEAVLAVLSESGQSD